AYATLKSEQAELEYRASHDPLTGLANRRVLLARLDEIAHMICSSCGSVRDVTLPEALERELDRSLARLAKRNDFAVREHRLDLVGVCACCS
ncbi:MAG: hypothetical protein ACKO91_02165, partial [Acidimicrobiales bacterium]